MSAAWIVLVFGWIFLLAFTIALVLSRRSLERSIRRQVATDIRDRARQVQRFSPDGHFALGLLTAASIADGASLPGGFVSMDASRRVRAGGEVSRG